MKMTKALSSAILALWVVVGPIYAHHASVGIDRSKTVTVEGVIKQFRWANPHSWIEMEVVDASGKAALWNFEMLPPTYLIPAGWTRTTIKPGDRVKVTANGFVDGSPGGIFVSVTLPCSLPKRAVAKPDARAHGELDRIARNAIAAQSARSQRTRRPRNGVAWAVRRDPTDTCKLLSAY